MLKSQIASRIDDDDMAVECAEKLISHAEGNMIRLLLPFMIHLFIGNFRRSYEIVSLMDGLDDEHQEMLKAAIYTHMSEDLDVDIRMSYPVQADVDEILDLLFKYKYGGIKSGTFKGALYVIA